MAAIIKGFLKLGLYSGFLIRRISQKKRESSTPKRKRYALPETKGKRRFLVTTKGGINRVKYKRYLIIFSNLNILKITNYILPSPQMGKGRPRR